MKRKRTEKSAELVVQPHGGALWGKDHRGRKVVPGTGRPPSEIRKRLRGSFDERVKVLEEIADSSDDDGDRIKAIDLLAKYGLGTVQEVSVEDVRDRLTRTVAEIRGALTEEQANVVLERIRPIWQ